MLTKQEIFNKVYRWFVIKKHGRSRSKHGCAYRGDNGCKCAAGVLIADEHYTPELEGWMVNTECV